MNTLPPDVVQNIAALTYDVSSVGKMMCVCTDLKTDKIKSVCSALSQQVTKGLLQDIVEEVKKFQVVRNDPDVSNQFVIDYLKELVRIMKIDSIHDSSFWQLVRIMTNTLNVSVNLATNTVAVLGGFDEFSTSVMLISEDDAIPAIKPFIMEKKTKYIIKVVNHKITVYISITFADDDDNIKMSAFTKPDDTPPFDVTNTNLDNIVKVIHERCSDDVFVNVNTEFQLLELDFLTSCESMRNRCCTCDAFVTTKKMYMKKYLTQEDAKIKLNIDTCRL